jgi:hypothetical protein
VTSTVSRFVEVVSNSAAPCCFVSTRRSGACSAGLDNTDYQLADVAALDRSLDTGRWFEVVQRDDLCKWFW